MSKLLNKINIIYNKLKYIYTEEGVFILLRRIIRYFIFILRVRVVDHQEIDRKWGKLKDRYSGERVFLIGNGPSLNQTPLYLLAKEHTICFNRFFLMIERLGWVPEMYACTDDRVLENIHEEILSNAYKFKFNFLPLLHPSSSRRYAKLFPDEDNILWLILNKFGFSIDLPFVGINKTVANVAIQILAYMGFKEIVLVGVDMDYGKHQSAVNENKRDVISLADDDPNHFDPRYFGKGQEYHTPRMDETLEKYEEAKIFLESLGVNVVNATVGGKLEIFPRKDFHSIIDMSESDQEKTFLKSCGLNHNSIQRFDQLISKAVEVTDESMWDVDADILITSASSANGYITKHINSHVPHGPFKEKYVFMKRK